MIFYTITFVAIILWVLFAVFSDLTDPYWQSLKEFYNDDKKDL